MKPTKLPITFKPTRPAHKLTIRRGKNPSRWSFAQAGARPVPGRSPVTLLLLLFPLRFNFQLSTCNSSTITGTIQNPIGNPYANNALFAPLSTPLASGNNIIASTPTNVVAAANGTFSVSLLQGDYLVTFGGLHRDS